jgi:hypothetical protein
MGQTAENGKDLRSQRSFSPFSGFRNRLRGDVPNEARLQTPLPRSHKSTRQPFDPESILI